MGPDDGASHGAPRDRNRRLDASSAIVSLLAITLACSGPSEAAALDEREHLRELTFVEPGAVQAANVDDHAALAAEVLSVHELLAAGAGNVAHLADCQRSAANATWHGEPRDFARFEERTKELVLHELPAASRAVEQVPSGAAEELERLLTARAIPRVGAADELESELAPAPGTMRRARRIHLEAPVAAYGPELGVAVAARPRGLSDVAAAVRAAHHTGFGRHERGCYAQFS